MRKVICLIEIVLLILNVIGLIYNYQNGNYKTFWRKNVELVRIKDSEVEK